MFGIRRDGWGWPARRLIDDILNWCNKDVSGAALMTADGLEWRRSVTVHRRHSGSWEQKERRRSCLLPCAVAFSDYWTVFPLFQAHRFIFWSLSCVRLCHDVRCLSTRKIIDLSNNTVKWTPVEVLLQLYNLPMKIFAARCMLCISAAYMPVCSVCPCVTFVYCSG